MHDLSAIRKQSYLHVVGFFHGHQLLANQNLCILRLKDRQRRSNILIHYVQITFVNTLCVKYYHNARSHFYIILMKEQGRERKAFESSTSFFLPKSLCNSTITNLTSAKLVNAKYLKMNFANCVRKKNGTQGTFLTL